MTNLYRELPGAGRRLRRQGAFSATAVLLLGLGIGFVTAVFSLVDAVLLAPLPVRDADRVVWLWQSDPQAGVPMVEISHPVLQDLRERSETLEDLAGTPSTTSLVSLEVGGESLDIPTALVSGNFFSLLGVQPGPGRSFLPEEDQAGAPEVVVVSHRFWQNHLAGAASATAQTLRLDGSVHQIIGVAPEGFSIPAGVDFWIPMRPALPQYVEDRGIRFVHGLGRIRPQFTAREAQAELREILTQIAEEHPQFAVAPEVELTPLRQSLVSQSRPLLLLSLCAVALVLAVACANVAHLFLVRGFARRREITIRTALGAGRGRLLAELAAETFWLGMGAILLGLGTAAVTLRVLRATVPAEIPRIEWAALDFRALGVAALCTAVSALAATALPMFLTSLRASAGEALRASAGSTLAETGGRTGRRKPRSFLAVSEVALALVLLLGASLLVQSLLSLRSLDPGFSPENVLAFSLQLPGDRYPEIPRRTAFLQQLEKELGGLPGVTDAGAVLIRPLKTTNGWDVPFTLEGQSEDDQKSNTPANFQVVGEGFFRSLRVPLLEGRAFDASDTETSLPVAIIGESLARRYWPRGSAVGQRLKTGSPESPAPWRTVVGVVADVRFRQWTSPTADLYVPLGQNPVAVHTPYSDFVLRTSGDPLAVLASVRRRIHSLDPEMPLRQVGLLDELVAQRLAPNRFAALLGTTFAAVALLLAVVGIYGVLSFSVAQRTREIGIRMALGAGRRRVLAMVLRDAFAIAVAGILLGGLVAAFASRALHSLLHGVGPFDTPTYLSIGLGLLVLSLLAAFLPARRASRVAPAVVLRGE